MTDPAAGERDDAPLEVIDGGLLTTVQDAGRPDWTHLGVPESGAADPWSLAVANLLVGNEPGAAALEMTIAGPTLAIRRPLVIGLAGADLAARVRDGRRLASGRTHRLVPGDVVEIPGAASGRPDSGARAYLAIPGGIDVPVVLGSRSTCLGAGFGGLAGRALRTGDVVAAGPLVRRPGHGAGGSPELVWPEPDRVAPARAGDIGRTVLRVLAGPAAGLASLAAGAWRVADAADRVGVRLDGGPLPEGIAGETTTDGVPWGAIQVPPDGRPIVLGADHGVTGGYPVVGVVISADLPILGQLRPGAAVRLLPVERDAAVAALRERRDALVAGAATLRDAAGWDALIDSAGG